MMEEKDAPLPFNDAASAKEEPTAFEKALKARFKPGTVKEIINTIEKLQVPLPRDDTQFLTSQEGVLIFSNRHGVMLRIEKEWGGIPDDEGFLIGTAVRANDSAWMLQPLGAVKTGEAVVEIIPGIHYEKNDAESRRLYWKMWSDGYTYWDDRIDNIGRLPKLPGPDVAVIVDRLAATPLSSGVEAARRALEILKGEKNLYKYRSPIRVEPSPNAELKQEWDQLVEEVLKRKPSLEGASKYDVASYEAFQREYKSFWPDGQKAPDFVLSEDKRLMLHRTMSLLVEDMKRGNVKSHEALGKDDPQEILWGDLKKAFQKAWDDPKKIGAFWAKVLAAKDEGRLVTGWNELKSDDPWNKTNKARQAAAAYEEMSEGIGRRGKAFRASQAASPEPA
jgi:hypothetical protein